MSNSSEDGSFDVHSEETKPHVLKAPPASLRKYLLKEPSRYEYTVVFDLDETLVWHPSPGVVYRRQGVTQLLEALMGKCELILWSASTRQMGELALNAIDPFGKYFDFVIFRDPSWFKDTASTKYCKYLSQLNRDPNKIVIVENSPNSVRFNKENAMIVEDFMSPAAPPDPTLSVVAQALLSLFDSHHPVPTFLNTYHAFERFALVRRNKYGAPIRSKAPGVFHRVRLPSRHVVAH